ncbi:MAG: 16S rRNA (guanine(527)-N(7))-methyltransferase RsmG, partial [Nitrobacter sp.]
MPKPQPAQLPLPAADKAAALALTPVSRETEARLDAYVDLLVQWQTKTNLIAPSTLPQLWTRHIADSLQLLALAPRAKRWADFGSGGGFPGVVLACALAEVRGARIDLVERNGKKAAFLREAIRVTGTPGVIHLADIGDYVDRLDGGIDCVTARALAPLQMLLGLAEPLVKRGAKALFLKGQDVEVELTEATKYWNIEPRLHSS